MECFPNQLDLFQIFICERARTKRKRGKGRLSPNKLWRWLYKSSFYHIKSVLLDTRCPSSACGEPWYGMVLNKTLVHVSWEKKKRKQLLLSLSAYGSPKSSENVPVDDCYDSGLDKTKWTNTSRWRHPKSPLTTKLHTRLEAVRILCLSSLPPDSGTSISKWNTKITFI